jgi:hypothetical protein
MARRRGGGGNSHQRKVQETTDATSADAGSGPSTQIPVTDGKSLGERILDFLEHQWMLWIFGVLGGIVGLIYTPALFLVAAVMAGAFYRTKVVRGMTWKIQVPSYAGIVVLSMGLVYGTIVLIKKSAHIPTSSEIAAAVISGLRASAPSKAPATPTPNQPTKAPDDRRSQALKPNPNLPSQPRKTPPHFILTGMNISGSRSAVPGDAAMIARFHLHLQNAGESASHGMEIQIAMLNYYGNARIPTTTAYSSPTEIEPGGGREFSSGDVVIPIGLTNEVIRIRLRYRNLDRPDKILPPQDIYQLWAGNRGGNPSPFFSDIDEQTNKDISEYFERNVPTQR